MEMMLAGGPSIEILDAIQMCNGVTQVAERRRGLKKKKKRTCSFFKGRVDGESFSPSTRNSPSDVTHVSSSSPFLS